MATCKQTNIPELDLEADPCGGERTSTDCVVQAAAITALNLPTNSTQTQINSAIVVSLSSLAARITALENI
jgi:hypothetical protein